MTVFSSPNQWRQRGSSCLTLGNFDGVHLGHRTLLETASRIASENKLSFLPVTFWPHPREVLTPARVKERLASREEKFALLQATGASAILEIPFSPGLAALSPTSFITQWLLPLRPSHIVIGHDFHFGSGRSGTLEVLTDIGKKSGFSITQISAARFAGAPISSTRVRQAILAGDMPLAASLLGRPYSLEGKVEHGFGRGRGLGFPTANITLPSKLIPPQGVYATRVWLGEKSWAGLTNIGFNPTFDGKKLTVETFLPDANIDLYEQTIKVEFLGKLRDEKKFASPEELKGQIGADIANARRIYAESVF